MPHRWDSGLKWTQNAIAVGHTASIDSWVLKDGCARGIRANHSQRMGILIRVQKVWRELTQEATQDDQESGDVDPSLKGPPAVHGWS